MTSVGPYTTRSTSRPTTAEVQHKRLTVLLTLAVLFVAANASAQMAPAGKGKPSPKPPTVFVDDFSDGNLVGWYVDEEIGPFKTARWSSDGSTSTMSVITS